LVKRGVFLNTEILLRTLAASPFCSGKILMRKRQIKETFGDENSTKVLLEIYDHIMGALASSMISNPSGIKMTQNRAIVF
jgi:hypothetical protein